jgi:GNAT superfamily N-acetyltransferase
LGFVGHGSSRDPDALTGEGEVRTMFVHPSAWGTGVAEALIARAYEQLEADGYTQVTLWTFVANERANAFYERHGMKRDGARRRQAVWADLDQVRLRRAL